MHVRRSSANAARYAAAIEICACSHFRRASRALTQLFDHSLQPSGLRSTQLVMLLEIAVAGRTTAPELAGRLVMERSTLARNLKLLAKHGWIKHASERKRRSRQISLTPLGLRTVQKAVPLWRRAQNTFSGQLGEKRWQKLQCDLSAAVAVALQNLRP